MDTLVASGLSTPFLLFAALLFGLTAYSPFVAAFSFYQEKMRPDQMIAPDWNTNGLL